MQASFDVSLRTSGHESCLSSAEASRRLQLADTPGICKSRASSEKISRRDGDCDEKSMLAAQRGVEGDNLTTQFPDLLGTFPEWCAIAIEIAGVAIIAVVAAYSLVHAVVRLHRGSSQLEVQQEVRQRMGRGILLGLEFLIAADIIRTVVMELTFSNVGVLALVVLIRTFLSFTLEIELGKWPWQHDTADK